MEIPGQCILSKNQFMKKMQILIIVLLVAGVLETKAQSQKELPPPPPPPKKIDIVKVKPPQLTESAIQPNVFYKRNPGVANLSWQGPYQITIKLKNGKQEEYDLSNGLQKKNFVDKYGSPPIPPPPPPPPKIGIS
jgi:hypothetical protein